MSDFHIGQLVICVNDSWWAAHRADWHLPRKGVVYTIRDLGPSYSIGSGVYLRTRELRNPIAKPFGAEPNFLTSRFRPVDPKAIAVFREALAPTPRAKTDA